MNKVKSLLTALCLAGLAACTVGFAACKNKKSEKPTQPEHNYSTEWSSNDEYHFHACTDSGCNSVRGSEAHKWGEWTVDTPASVEAKGKEKRECTVCKRTEYKDIDKLTPPAPVHEHTPGEWVNTDPTGHYKRCADPNCDNPNAKLEAGGHNTNGAGGSCSACGYKATPEVHTHTPGGWVNTDPTGHYKRCNDPNCDNPNARIEEKEHDTDGKDGVEGACSVCGYIAPADAYISPSAPSATVKVGGGNTATIIAYSLGNGYYTYTYEGDAPITIAYNYYVLGKGEVSDTITLSSEGDHSFMAKLSTKATCKMVVTSTEETPFNATISLEFSDTDPTPAKALNLDTATTVNATYEGVRYGYTAEATGRYSLACTDSEAVILIYGSRTPITLPYNFKLEKGGEITFFMCCKDIENPAATYDVTLSVVSLHIHDWGDGWTVAITPKVAEEGKATRTCINPDCDATAEEKEYTLPNLLSVEYSITNSNATCTEAGEATYNYNKNGVTVSFTAEAPATGHDWSAWKATTTPTEEEEGEATLTCANCGALGDSTHTLPALLSSDYTKSDNTATCEEAGEATYYYNKNGVIVSFTAATKALGHKYGDDWIIENPSDEAEGNAYKYCANDKEHEHDIHVELPVLSDSDYFIDEDESGTTYTYTLMSDETIVFTVHKELNVERAVDVAVSNMDKVLGSKINKTTKMAVAEPTSSKVAYEKGNNYVHIKDEGVLTTDYGGVEMFVSKLEDGTYFFPYKVIVPGTGYIDMDDPNYKSVKNQVQSIYIKLSGSTSDAERVKASFEIAEILGTSTPVLRDGNKVSVFETEKLFIGAPYTLMYAEHDALRSTYHYGIENLIKTFYEIAKTNPNNDFTENVSEPDANGVTTYSFSFGYKGTYEGYFAVYSVEFKLDKNSAMVGATVDNRGYTNKNGTTFIEQDGKYVVTAPANTLWIETYSVSQSRLQTGTKPTNPYNPEELKVTGFGISMVEEEVLVDNPNYTITGLKTINASVGNSLDAVAGGSIYLRLTNVTPASASLFMDEVKLSLYTADGTFIEELSDNYADGNDGHVKATYNAADNLLSLSFWIAGDYRLKISTANVEKVINLHIPYEAPTNFGADVYQYNDVLDVWNNYNTTYEVYEGQALAFTSTSDHSAYQDTGYMVTVTNAAGETVTEDVVSEPQYIDGMEGRQVRLFRALSAGTYTVTITSTHDGLEASASFTVTVKEAPDVAAMISHGIFDDEDNGEKTVTVEFKADDNAVIKMGEEETTVTYTYDEDTHEFAVTHVSGPDKNYGFKLSEAFNLYLMYGNSDEKVLIKRTGTVSDTLSGTYKTEGTKHRILTASASGTYRITVESGSTANLFYKFGDNEPAAANGAQLALVKGSSFEVWSLDDSKIITYKIERAGNLVDVTGVTLADAEVYLGKTVTLNPVFTPANASVKTGTWSSSDEAIATVENGVVTGVSAGEVTITFKADDGGFEATCTVTVEELLLTPGENTITVIGWGYVVFKFKGEINATYGIAGHAGCTFYLVNESGEIIYGSGKAELGITTNANGVAYFAVYYDGNYNEECIVTINITKAISATGITVDKNAIAAIEFIVGDTIDLTQYVTVAPADAFDKSFTITSSDESVADNINTTSLKAIGKGSATITVTTANGCTDSFTITVKPHTIAVDTTKVLEAGSFYREYYIELVGGTANTTYVFTATPTATSNTYPPEMAIVVNGLPVGPTQTYTLELTTDENGNLTIYVKARNSCAINLSVVEKPTTPPAGRADISVGEIIELNAEADENEYFVTLKGGKARKNYIFTATISPAGGGLFTLSSVTNGEADYKNTSSDGKLSLITDASGNVTIYIYTTNKGTINISVEEEIPEINVGEVKKIHFEPYGSEIVLLKGGEAGKTYSFYTSSGVTLAPVNEDGTPDLTKSTKTGTIDLTAGEGGKLSVYIKVPDATESAINLSVMEKGSSNLTPKEESDGVIFIDGPGDYGVNTGLNYSAVKVLYKLVVPSGEEYSITNKQNAYLSVGRSYQKTTSAYNVNSQINNITNITEGTYYIGLCAYTNGTAYGWFTVTKLGDPDVLPYTPYDEIEYGETECNMTGSPNKDFSFKGTAGTTYTITVSGGLDVYERDILAGTNIGNGGSSVQITADEYGYVNFRVVDFSWNAGLVTITIEEGTGSSTGGGDEGVQHTNEHTLNYESKDADKHTVTCTFTGCNYVTTEENHHYDDDNDTTCNDCGYTRTISGGGGGGGDTLAVGSPFTVTVPYWGSADVPLSGCEVGKTYKITAKQGDNTCFEIQFIISSLGIYYKPGETEFTYSDGLAISVYNGGMDDLTVEIHLELV